MASISFDDGLTSGGETIIMADDGMPTSRFNNWIFDPDGIGERANGLGDGRLYQYQNRIDYKASFEMPRIPQTSEDLLQRFKYFAESGGLFTVTTDDAESNEYAECQVAENTKIAITKNRETMEWTLSMTIVNMAVSPIALRCFY
jgi:hypothetical protein